MDALKKIIAWLPMHALYLIGDGVSGVMNLVPERIFGRSTECVFDVLYPIYNRCMTWSARLNDWAGFKLWIVE